MMTTSTHASEQARGTTVVDGSAVRQSRDAFPEQITGQYKLVLLEEGSCCWIAGEFFAENAFEHRPELVSVDSFARGTVVAKDPGHILLLPHVHNLCGDIETEAGWESIGSAIFRLPNPPLHLARNRSSRTHRSAKGRCASIDRLFSLLEPTTEGFQQIEVESTQSAARMCRDGVVEFCITNASGLATYDLRAERQLKHMEICWFPYRYNPSEVV